ncbi:MAG: hypothetical protein AB1832_19120 [Pseudomonadota bacterium]
MKSRHRLLVSALLLLGVVGIGIGSATAQTVIVVCQRCILTYQDCLNSGHSATYCQAYSQLCCPTASATGAVAQPIADRAKKSGRG